MHYIELNIFALDFRGVRSLKFLTPTPLLFPCWTLTPA